MLAKQEHLNTKNTDAPYPLPHQNQLAPTPWLNHPLDYNLKKPEEELALRKWPLLRLKKDSLRFLTTKYT